jgi:hypothetical protein
MTSAASRPRPLGVAAFERILREDAFHLEAFVGWSRLR